MSSCGHVDPLGERFASWICQQDRPFPSQSSSALLSDLHDTEPEDLQPRRAWAQFYEWLEDWSPRQVRRNVSVGQFFVPCSPGTGKTDGVRLLVSLVRGTFLECDMREVEGRKLVEMILKGQGGLRQTSVAILNIDTDVTDGLKWRLCKAAQQLQIPLIFVCDDGVVTARNELEQKCLCLEVRHKPQIVEQASRRMTQRNGLDMPEACLSIAIACGHDVYKAINTAQLLGQRFSSSELPTADLPASAACHQLLLPSDATDVPEVLELLEQGGEELCRALQRQCLASCGENFETLDHCAFAAETMAGAVSALRKQRCHHFAQACPMESPQMIQVSGALIATLSTQTRLIKGRLGQSLDRSQSRGAQDDTDELDRTLKYQDERRRADERRTSNSENEVEGSSCVKTVMERIDWRRARMRSTVRHLRKSTPSQMATGTKTLLCSSRKTRWTPC